MKLVQLLVVLALASSVEARRKVANFGNSLDMKEDDMNSERDAALFAAMDTNGDGFISPTEFSSFSSLRRTMNALVQTHEELEEEEGEGRQEEKGKLTTEMTSEAAAPHKKWFDKTLKQGADQQCTNAINEFKEQCPVWNTAQCTFANNRITVETLLAESASAADVETAKEAHNAKGRVWKDEKVENKQYPVALKSDSNPKDPTGAMINVWNNFQCFYWWYQKLDANGAFFAECKAAVAAFKDQCTAWGTATCTFDDGTGVITVDVNSDVAEENSLSALMAHDEKGREWKDANVKLPAWRDKALLPKTSKEGTEYGVWNDACFM